MTKAAVYWVGKLNVLTSHAVRRSFSGVEMVIWTIIVRASAVVPPFWLVTLLHLLVDLIKIFLDKTFGGLSFKMDFLNQLFGDLNLGFILRL